MFNIFEEGFLFILRKRINGAEWWSFSFFQVDIDIIWSVIRQSHDFDWGKNIKIIMIFLRYGVFYILIWVDNIGSDRRGLLGDTQLSPVFPFLIPTPISLWPCPTFLRSLRQSLSISRLTVVVKELPDHSVSFCLSTFHLPNPIPIVIASVHYKCSQTD